MSLNVSCPSRVYDLADKMNLTFREGTSLKKKKKKKCLKRQHMINIWEILNQFDIHQVLQRPPNGNSGKGRRCFGKWLRSNKYKAYTGKYWEETESG